MNKRGVLKKPEHCSREDLAGIGSACLRIQ